MTAVANIVIAGAGSIGCFTGALLAADGQNVTLLGRARILDAIRAHGLTVTDYDGLNVTAPAMALTLAETPECLAQADIVIVAVKSAATARIAADIAQYAPQNVPIVSFQNGIENIQTLRDALPGRDVRAGMVPFNVVPSGDAAFHRATSGDVVIESGPGELGALLSSRGLTVEESDQITAIQWGKLVLNLNNAINALSGLPLLDQLMIRDWRRLMADQMAEALLVLKSAGIEVKSTTPLPTWLGPHVLRLPTPLFKRIAAQMLTIDPKARTSMAYDVIAGRHTEIDALQGEFLRLGADHGVATPIMTRIADQIRQVEREGNKSPNLTPAALRP